MSDEPTADFVWRFRLNEVRRQPVHDDPLLELIRTQWEELLKLTVPMLDGRPVKVDGFALMREPDRAYDIHREVDPAAPVPSEA
jgi:hypothetical protein